MKTIQRVGLLATAALLPGVARAQLVISDTLTGASSSYNWKAFNGACLTTGNGSGIVPACSGLSYYSGTTLVGGVAGTLPDAVGSGALRLTNGDTTTDSNDNNQTDAIVPNLTFPTNQGVQVTFTTVTYGGNAYKNAADQASGADGISFFLADGRYPATVGALRGSLGHSRSNGNPMYNGVQGGYIDLGIDEFGNFSNAGDNISSGASGGVIPGRINSRGAGNTNWANLSTKYAKYYPLALSTTQMSAVQSTRAAGYLYNLSDMGQQGANGYYTDDGSQTTEQIPYNYNYLDGDMLSSTVKLYSREAARKNSAGGSKAVRGNAILIAYALSITQDGLLSLSYNVNGGTAQPVITSQSITASDGSLPASSRFGSSAGTGGGSNVHEITCFKAASVGQANSSAGTSVRQSACVEAGAQVYLAYYHPTNWWGGLTVQNLVMNPVTGVVSIATNAN